VTSAAATSCFIEQRGVKYRNSQFKNNYFTEMGLVLS